MFITMKNTNKYSIFLSSFLLFVIIFLHSASGIKAHESAQVDHKSEFSYIEGNERGPSHWGDLNKEWETCKNGAMQSPIDLSNQIVKVIPEPVDLKFSYKPGNTTIKNRGHDISLQWAEDAGSIEINGTKYDLQQLHWHSPSEHSINGRRYELEVHIVHKTSDPNPKIAVVSLLYEIGQCDPLISKLKDDIITVSGKKGEISQVGSMAAADIKMGNKHFRYMGSLTSPPCTEGVIWTINEKINTASWDQVNLLRLAVDDNAEKNARPVQPVNGREIHLYSPN